MKIAFWHYYTFRFLRGIETLVLSLSNALVRKQMDVSLITAAYKNQPLIPPDPRLKIHAFPPTYYYAYLTIIPFYAFHLMKHRYDRIVVFFADYGEGLTWQLLRKFRDLPLVLYLCYPFSNVPHRYQSFVKYGWHREVNYLLADAGWIAEEAERFLQRQVKIVPIGTDPVRFQADPGLRREFRQKWGFSESDVVLLNVSSLEKRKGTWRGVDAMERLHLRIPQLRFVILGTGEDEIRLRKRVKEAGLEKKIFFAGETTQLEAYYSMADIFLMLPDAEGNSIACHEAMSSGLPVIVTDSSGFRETLPPTAGRVVNVYSMTDIDNAIESLSKDEALRAGMGQMGRAHILNHCTWDSIAEKFLEAIC